jgi:hypothetical protein
MPPSVLNQTAKGTTDMRYGPSVTERVIGVGAEVHDASQRQT